MENGKFSSFEFGLQAGKAGDEAELPGPAPLPVIGSLHLMAKFNKYPFECFTRLKKVRILHSVICQILYLHSILTRCSRSTDRYFK